MAGLRGMNTSLSTHVARTGGSAHFRSTCGPDAGPISRSMAHAGATRSASPHICAASDRWRRLCASPLCSGSRHTMPDDSMFAALAAEDAVNPADANAGPTAHRQTLTPIVPVPTDAPPCRWRHPKYGDPVAMWPYLDAANRLVGYAARIEYGAPGERNKDVYPLTYCRVEESARCYQAWRSHAVPT